MHPLARFLGRCLWRLLLTAGWIAAALVVLLTLGEQSGFFANLARSELQRFAGTLPTQLRDARVAWFDTRIDLYGLELGTGRELVQVEKLELHWRLSSLFGAELTRFVLRDGHLAITPAFVKQVEERSGKHTGALANGSIPPIEVRGLKLEADNGRFPLQLGSVDLVASSTAGLLEATGWLHARSWEIYLHAALGADQQLEIVTRATGLPLNPSVLPEGSLLDAVRPYQPKGALGLEGHVRADLRPQGRAEGKLRLAIADASLFVGKHLVDRIALDFDGKVEAEDASKVFDPAVWDCTLRLSGRWEGHEFDGWGFLGPMLAGGARARGFAHVAALPLDGGVLDLVTTDPVVRAKLGRRWEAFTPRGEAQVWASLELPEPLPGIAASLDELRVATEADLGGKAGLCYQGWPGEAAGEHDPGFPLALESVQGSVIFGRDPRSKHPNLLGLAGLRGRSECGEIQAAGLVHAHAIDDPPTLPGFASSEFDLHFESAALTQGPLLESALLGLGEAVPSESTWKPYQPLGGTLRIEHLRLVRKVDMPFSACDLALRLDGTQLAWTELPVPIAIGSGRLLFRSNGKGERGLSAAFEQAGLPSQGARLALALRIQNERSEPDQLSFIEAHVGALSLAGDEKKLLVKRFTDVGAALERMAPKGLVDIDVQRTQTGAGAPTLWRAEITPIEVQLQPQSFRVNISKVRGRVIVGALEPHEPTAPIAVETALAPLLGVAQGIECMGFAARLPGEHVDLWAAGIHLDDSNVRGALGDSAGKVDLGGLKVAGSIDLAGKILLAPAEAAGGGLAAQLYLRSNTFTFRKAASEQEAHELVLKDMRGRLELAGAALAGARLHAVLGRTPVELQEIEFQTDKGRFQLRVGIESRGLPLDREHLCGFVDEKTLAALVDELHLAGSLDLQHGRIDISGSSAADSQLRFSGDLLLHDTSVQLGLPWTITSAQAHVKQLLVESGRLRANASISALEGRIAGREISNGNMLLTYVEPRLSIEDLAADLEGGKLRSLGASAQRSGTAFSIGLEKPYPFQVALELLGVSLGRLLRGVFDSDFAAKGSLDAELRLQGNTDNVLGIQGAGKIDIKDSRLWSIPVFRELFSQIGLDNAAVFERMFANLHVHDGRIEMSDIGVASKILQLHCDHGWVDGDGEMHFDLDLRYPAVERLGPITRLIYWVQNQLLSVSIRGDMARPSVVMKNPISSLFGGGKHRRALPLPPFSPLPPRF